MLVRHADTSLCKGTTDDPSLGKGTTNDPSGGGGHVTTMVKVGVATSVAQVEPVPIAADTTSATDTTTSATETTASKFTDEVSLASGGARLKRMRDKQGMTALDLAMALVAASEGSEDLNGPPLELVGVYGGVPSSDTKLDGD
jgi:hypothetical protein